MFAKMERPRQRTLIELSLAYPVRYLLLLATLALVLGGPAVHADDVFYAASGQGGREYSVFNDASTNAGSTPAGAFRVGFNGDGRERQYAAKFNVARAAADPSARGVANLRLFAGSSTGSPDTGFDVDAGPYTQQDGVTVGVFLVATAADASARIDPRFPKPGGGTYKPADSEFVDVAAVTPVAVFSADELRDGVSVDVTPAFREARANHGVLLVVLAPVADVSVDGGDLAVSDRGSPRDQTYVFRSGKAPDVPEDKRLRIEWSVP